MYRDRGIEQQRKIEIKMQKGTEKFREEVRLRKERNIDIDRDIDLHRELDIE